MISQSEGFYRPTNYTTLFYQLWSTKNSKGVVLITHGLGEHSDCYAHLAHSLGERGWICVAWDLRGHGRSGGQRGYVRDFSDFSNDLKSMSKYVQDTYCCGELPLVLFSHSLGGLITFKHLLEHGQEDYLGACFSSPLLGVAVDIPPIKKFFAKKIGKLIPRITLKNEINHNDLVRDKEFIKTYSQDHLRQEKISPLLFTGILENCDNVIRRSPKITLPLLLQIAGDDKIVDKFESERVFEKISSKTKKIIEYKDSRHEIINDLDKKTVINDLADFLDQLIKPSGNKK